MKVCLDSNVIVSAFATRGLAADVFELVLTEHELVLPEVVLAEVLRILRTKIKLTPAALERVERFLTRHPAVPKPSKKLDVVVRDPADAWVLASAVAGKAEVLVTGDKDLLDIAARAPLPILTPRAFWERCREAKRPGAS